MAETFRLRIYSKLPRLVFLNKAGYENRWINNQLANHWIPNFRPGISIRGVRGTLLFSTPWLDNFSFGNPLASGHWSPRFGEADLQIFFRRKQKRLPQMMFIFFGADGFIDVEGPNRLDLFVFKVMTCLWIFSMGFINSPFFHHGLVGCLCDLFFNHRTKQI